MKFIIFVIDGHASSGTQEEMQAVDIFNEKLQNNGNWLLAAGIAAPENAILIDNRNGIKAKTEGSLFSGEPHYSGFWVIEAESDSEAETLAFEGSRACNRRVELRPFLR
jgi:hypothetical protein